MSDQDEKDELFGKGDQTPVSDTGDTLNQEPTLDPFADQLGTIKREDGTQKFADVASALDSITHSDTHISTIEAENAKLKDDLARETAAKELLAKSANNQNPAQKALTAEDIGDIVDQRTAQRETANQQDANVSLVREQFSKKFGDKAGEEMSRVASSSGMTKTELKTLSASSPQAVLQLAGIKVVSTPVHKTPYTPGVEQPSPQPEPQEVKSIMGGSNTKEMVSAWRGAGERSKQ